MYEDSTGGKINDEINTAVIVMRLWNKMPSWAPTWPPTWDRPYPVARFNHPVDEAMILTTLREKIGYPYI